MPFTISTGLFYFSREHTHTLLQLVQACSILYEALHIPSCNQYRPVLFHKRPYTCLPAISTGLFFLTRDHTHAILQLIQACSNLKSLYNTIICIYHLLSIPDKTNDATQKGGVIRIRIIVPQLGVLGYIRPLYQRMRGHIVLYKDIRSAICLLITLESITVESITVQSITVEPITIQSIAGKLITVELLYANQQYEGRMVPSAH